MFSETTSGIDVLCLNPALPASFTDNTQKGATPHSHIQKEREMYVARNSTYNSTYSESLDVPNIDYYEQKQTFLEISYRQGVLY